MLMLLWRIVELNEWFATPYWMRLCFETTSIVVELLPVPSDIDQIVPFDIDHILPFGIVHFFPFDIDHMKFHSPYPDIPAFPTYFQYHCSSNVQFLEGIHTILWTSIPKRLTKQKQTIKVLEMYSF